MYCVPEMEREKKKDPSSVCLPKHHHNHENVVSLSFVLSVISPSILFCVCLGPASLGHLEISSQVSSSVGASWPLFPSLECFYLSWRHCHRLDCTSKEVLVKQMSLDSPSHWDWHSCRRASMRGSNTDSRLSSVLPRWATAFHCHPRHVLCLQEAGSVVGRDQVPEENGRT